MFEFLTNRPPRINDISTDLVDVPQFSLSFPGPKMDRSYDPSFKEQQSSYYTDLKPLLSKKSEQEVFKQALELAKATPDWQIEITDPKNLTIEGTATTAIMRFKDDFVIRITKTPSGAKVDMRSKSRLGKADFAANAKRIQSFFANLNSKIN